MEVRGGDVGLVAHSYERDIAERPRKAGTGSGGHAPQERADRRFLKAPSLLGPVLYNEVI